MKTPKLKKIESVKKHHGISLEDDYAWVDQHNILEVLKDPNKLLPEVRNYIEAVSYTHLTLPTKRIV